MQLSKAAVSLLFFLGCSNQFRSSFAFTTPSKSVSFYTRTNTEKSIKLRPSQLRMVASSETLSVADMQRGIGGRLEDAFEAAKERGEAAFVTFVTAGYPRADGRLAFHLMIAILALTPDLRKLTILRTFFNRHSCDIARHAGWWCFGD
jgi:hypothetical protein